MDFICRFRSKVPLDVRDVPNSRIALRSRNNEQRDQALVRCPQCSLYWSSSKLRSMPPKVSTGVAMDSKAQVRNDTLSTVYFSAADPIQGVNLYAFHIAVPRRSCPVVLF